MEPRYLAESPLDSFIWSTASGGCVAIDPHYRLAPTPEERAAYLDPTRYGLGNPSMPGDIQDGLPNKPTTG
jgi:hypothetical protein